MGQEKKEDMTLITAEKARENVESWRNRTIRGVLQQIQIASLEQGKTWIDVMRDLNHWEIEKLRELGYKVKVLEDEKLNNIYNIRWDD